MDWWWLERGIEVLEWVSWSRVWIGEDRHQHFSADEKKVSRFSGTPTKWLSSTSIGGPSCQDIRPKNSFLPFVQVYKPKCLHRRLFWRFVHQMWDSLSLCKYTIDWYCGPNPWLTAKCSGLNSWLVRSSNIRLSNVHYTLRCNTSKEIPKRCWKYKDRIPDKINVYSDVRERHNISVCGQTFYRSYSSNVTSGETKNVKIRLRNLSLITVLDNCIPAFGTRLAVLILCTSHAMMVPW